MTSQSQSRRRLIVPAAMVLLLAGMVLLCGCTTQPGTTPATPTATTAVPTQTTPAGNATMTVYNETANGTTAKIPLDGGCIVQLAENPTTGYAWNASVTSGLSIVNSTYTADPKTAGMAGAGGMHSWTLKGTAAGQQQFSAVYLRSWENKTGNETTFVLNVLVG